MDGSSRLVSGVKFSSVVPAKATGEEKVHDLTAMDLVMKLHYIKGVYLFRSSERVRRLTIRDLKEPMFPLLELYKVASGRIRRSSGQGERPFIKCNDSGVRIVEAECGKSMDEWLLMEGGGDDSDSQRSSGGLVYSQALGPDLGFSPLVFIQLTRFRCGGLAVGLSWAHVLGDFFSASTFMAMWGHIMTGHLPPQTLHKPKPPPATLRLPHSTRRAPSSIKRVDPTGDLWIASNDCKMAAHSFRITEEQLDRILRTVSSRNQAAKFSCFAAISAILWKSISKIRGDHSDSGPNSISVYTTKSPNRYGEIPSNGMVVSAVEAEEAAAGAEEGALAELIMEKRRDESGEVEEMVERGMGESDYVAYGARLTFVDLEEADIYGLELGGQKPIRVDYEVGGAGERGVVLVLRGPPGCDGGESRGRTARVTLPEKQLAELRDELKKQWAIV